MCIKAGIWILPRQGTKPPPKLNMGPPDTQRCLRPDTASLLGHVLGHSPVLAALERQTKARCIYELADVANCGPHAGSNSDRIKTRLHASLWYIPMWPHYLLRYTETEQVYKTVWHISGFSPSPCLFFFPPAGLALGLFPTPADTNPIQQHSCSCHHCILQHSDVDRQTDCWVRANSPFQLMLKCATIKLQPSRMGRTVYWGQNDGLEWQNRKGATALGGG